MSPEAVLMALAAGAVVLMVIFAAVLLLAGLVDAMFGGE
jgi:hypothetical protein